MGGEVNLNVAGQAGRAASPAPARQQSAMFAKGEMMGKEARVALLLAGSACLLAVMVEWVISELESGPSS